jgi:hypothetical protein
MVGPASLPYTATVRARLRLRHGSGVSSTRYVEAS